MPHEKESNAPIAVIFEVTPTAEGKAQYLQIAAELREHIMKAEGIISFERFSSLNNEGKLLSLSFWESMESIKHWRNTLAHRLAQQAGFADLFEHYRIRVARIERDYSMSERAEAPEDSNCFLSR